MKIAVTDSMGAEYKFELYITWLLRGDPRLEWTKISYLTDGPETVRSFDGLVLTGGGDVDPRIYGGDAGRPDLDRVDRRRDDFERRVIDSACAGHLPVLGICRGVQIANVHFGGSLYEDLVDAGFTAHESDSGTAREHTIVIEERSLLASVTGVTGGVVNSYHHQSANRIGDGLRVTARSADGVAECLEFQDSATRAFFLGVQWHPERMEDDGSPFSSAIRTRFFQQLRSSRKQ